MEKLPVSSLSGRKVIGVVVLALASVVWWGLILASVLCFLSWHRRPVDAVVGSGEGQAVPAASAPDSNDEDGAVRPTLGPPTPAETSADEIALLGGEMIGCKRELAGELIGLRNTRFPLRGFGNGLVVVLVRDRKGKISRHAVAWKEDFGKKLLTFRPGDPIRLMGAIRQLTPEEEEEEETPRAPMVGSIGDLQRRVTAAAMTARPPQPPRRSGLYALVVEEIHGQ